MLIITNYHYTSVILFAGILGNHYPFFILILELPGGEKWAIEVKSGLGPKLTKGFHHSIKDINPDRSFVVYAGSERYPITETSEAISLAELAQELSEQR